MCRPGVSISRICASGSLRIPRIRRRVVCGRGVTIATLCPTIRFTIVDLPTLVRPPTATNPARCSPIALTALLFDLVERKPRRGLLALLLAAALAHAEFAARDSDSGREPFRVIGSFGRDQFVHRLRAIVSICDLLQFGFVIALGGWAADIIGKQALVMNVTANCRARMSQRGLEQFRSREGVTKRALELGAGTFRRRGLRRRC